MSARRLAVLLLVLLPGCAFRYAVGPPSLEGGWLGPESNVYLAVPKDGRDRRPRTYVGSGNQTTRAMVDALQRCGLEPTVGPFVDRPEQALAAARAAGAHFVVYTTIEDWTDRITELSTLTDRIVLRVMLSEVPGGKVLDVRRLEATGRWGSFGRDHPEQMLPELARRWVDGMCVSPGSR